MAFLHHPRGLKNVEQPPPAVLFKSRRGRLLHIDQEFFTVKLAATKNILAPEVVANKFISLV
jgi:hypothetical protein